MTTGKNLSRVGLKIDEMGLEWMWKLVEGSEVSERWREDERESGDCFEDTH